MRKHIGSLTCAAIFFLAAALRIYTFVFPHNHGDQIIYAALAQNIANDSRYNLLQTEIVKTNISGFAFLTFPACNTNSSNSIAELFKKGGADIYTDNIFFRPPLFPFLIQLFNRQILSFDIPQKYFHQHNFFTVWLKKQNSEKLLIIVKKQFGVAFFPFLGSMLILAGVFYISVCYSRTAAIWAMLIAALAPVELFCATRVLPDTLMTAFLFWAFIFAEKIKGKKGIFLTCLAIVAAVYVKESAVIICSAVFFIMALISKQRKKYLFLSLFSVACYIPWLALLLTKNGVFISKVYHHPQLNAYWFNGAFNRGYFFHIYFPFYLYPILLFAFVYYFTNSKKEDFGQNFQSFLLFPPIATIIIITILKQEECRQILPAYPFLYVSAALGLEKIREKINARFQPAAGFVIILLIILMSAYYAFMKISPSLFGNAGGIFLT